MVRAFIAIELPVAIRENIAQTQEELVKCDARLKIVKPGDMHITLKFLGEINPETLENVKSALQDIKHEAYTMQMLGVSGNNPKRPRVVWAVGHDNDESAAIHQMIEDALAPFGIQREKRSFTPHATLARVKDFDRSLIKQITELSSTDFGTFTVSGFTLKKSTLTPEGPIYENIIEVHL